MAKCNKSDPSSPRPKRWSLAIRSIDPLSGLANALRDPPGKYGRKAKTQRNRRGLAQAVDYVAQFDGKRRTLPGLEILVKSLRNFRPRKTLGQVMHGRRQFVVWIVPLSGLTNATLVVCYKCHTRPPSTTFRKVMNIYYESSRYETFGE